MEIIKITQLPMVEDMLENQGEKIKAELAHVSTLVCTEENKKEVKKIRALYNADLKVFDEQFKKAISELEEPVNRLKTAYNKHIKMTYKEADIALKEKISFIETSQKEQKESEVKAYFEEYKSVVDNGLIDFVAFNHCISSVGLSGSIKSYTTKVKETLDKIVAETNSIATMEDKDVILLDYTQHLDFAKAVGDNAERKQKLAEQQKLLEKRKNAEEERKARLLEELARAEQEPKIEPIQAPVLVASSVENQTKDPDEIITVKFTVKGRRENVKKLGDFMKSNNILYKIIKE